MSFLLHTGVLNYFFNKKVLLSLGAMRTQVDDVRFLQNSSSGRMGLELARSLLNSGACVHLLAGFCDPDVENDLRFLGEKYSSRVQLTRFDGLVDYEKNLKSFFPDCGLFVSVAAVLDFEIERIE